jgi:UDP-N-acetylglucosamine 2-epimerase (non-hydrolysing)
VEVTGLTSHESFVRLLTRAPFVVTDGGSVQEECALLGVPTLLWRDRSERPDGLGDNIVLSHYRRAIIDDFVADPGFHRREARLPDARPSEEILAVLLDTTSAS